MFHTFRYGSIKFPIFGFMFGLVVFVLMFIANFSINKKSLISLFVLVLLLVSNFNINTTNLYQIKYFLYLIPITLLAFSYTRIDLYKAFKVIAYYYSIMSIFLFHLGIGREDGYGSPRMHGFLSEPSAFTLLGTIVFVSFLATRQKKLLILSFLIVLYCQSLTLMVSLFLSFFLYLLVSVKVHYRIIIFSVSIVTIILSYYFLLYLADVYSNENLDRLVTGLQYIVTLGENGHNPRFKSVIEIINYVSNNQFWFGQGLNAGELYVNDTGNLRDLNFWLELQLAFGMFSVIFVFSIVLFKYLFSKENTECRYFNAIFISFLCYCSLNSAQGIVFQQFFIILLIMLFLRNNTRMQGSVVNG